MKKLGNLFLSRLFTAQRIGNLVTHSLGCRLTNWPLLYTLWLYLNWGSTSTTFYFIIQSLKAFFSPRAVRQCQINFSSRSFFIESDFILIFEPPMLTKLISSVNCIKINKLALEIILNVKNIIIALLEALWKTLSFPIVTLKWAPD